MSAAFYKIKCLTNLHVGNGEVNYSIIDNEVQKDINSDNPAIYASGLKGALRQHYGKMHNGNDVEEVFGPKHDANSGKTGKYKFFEGRFLARPLRVTGDKDLPSYVLVTTKEAIQQFVEDCNIFNAGITAADGLTEALNGITGESFWVSDESFTKGMIEGEKPVKLDWKDKQIGWVKNLLGIQGEFAITTNSNLSNFALPVLARNQLEDGTSKNLWYEEVVPRESLFYFLVLGNEETSPDLSFDGLVQIGGNATIGYGFTQIEQIKKESLS